MTDADAMIEFTKDQAATKALFAAVDALRDAAKAVRDRGMSPQISFIRPRYNPTNVLLDEATTIQSTVSKLFTQPKETAK